MSTRKVGSQDRRPRRCVLAASTTSSGVASVTARPCAGNRSKRRGVRGGRERSAWRCALVRGRMHPTSETNSRM
ncbi:Uncharacterised protein [Mycobacteroides abscessus]|nr:Uncharacterised protein [Mycobacteroides abscessus]